MKFAALGLSGKVLEGVNAMGYTDPTPIQLRAIPLVLSGKDVIGSAQTGTGKTAAFALPILSKLGAHMPAGPRVLILEPTRELAAQVETAIRDYARFTDLKITVVYRRRGLRQAERRIQGRRGHRSRHTRPPARPSGARHVATRQGGISRPRRSRPDA